MELRQCIMVSSCVRTLTICSYPRPDQQPTISMQTLRSLERSFDEIRLAILWLVRSMKGRSETNHTATRAITEAIQLGKIKEEFASSKRELTYLKQRLFGDEHTRSDNYNNHQAESLSRLTILATCFLPLSVSATVLSMQTRFAKLGFLLYDLVGVTFLLGLLAWTGFLCSKKIMVVRKRRYKNGRSKDTIIYRVLTYLLVVIMTGGFMKGMFSAEELRIWLGIQTATAVLCVLFLLGIRFCI